MTESNFFFIKYFNKNRAEEFVNQVILPVIHFAVPNSARFYGLNHILRTDHGYDDYLDYDESINLTFYYQTIQENFNSRNKNLVIDNSQARATKDIELVIILLYHIPDESTDDKRIGGDIWGGNKAKYIYDWTVEQSFVSNLLDKTDDDKLLEKIMSFIEIAEVNAYWRYEKRYHLDRKNFFDAIDDHYNSIAENQTGEYLNSNYCARCHENPCACSDPDPG